MLNCADGLQLGPQLMQHACASYQTSVGGATGLRKERKIGINWHVSGVGARRRLSGNATAKLTATDELCQRLHETTTDLRPVLNTDRIYRESIYGLSSN
jgi:hypothetical protein